MKSGHPRAAWRALLPAGVLVLAVLLAGCTGTSSGTVSPPPTPTFAPGQVLQVIGDVTGNGFMLTGVPRGTIDTVTFTIGLVPGIQAVNLDNLTVIFVDAVHTTTLGPVDNLTGTPGKGQWGIVAFKNQPGKPNHRLDFDKEAVISVGLKDYLVPGELFTIVVKPAEGKALSITRVAPHQIAAGDNVLGPP